MPQDHMAVTPKGDYPVFPFFLGVNGLPDSNDNRNRYQSLRMKERRFPSKIKQKQQETRTLEEQTRQMEDKLSLLKQQIEEQKRLRSEMKLDSTVTRWQKATGASKGPLKSYAKQVLEEQRQVHSQFGISQKKVLGTKTFQGALRQLQAEREEEEHRNPTKVTGLLPSEPQAQGQVPPQLKDNFFRAKLETQALVRQKGLADFLEDNYILEYLPAFEAAGVADLHDLSRLSRQDLQDLGVRPGHQLKIIKKLKDELDPAPKQQHPPAPPQKVDSGYGEGDVTKEGREGNHEQNNIQDGTGVIPLQSRLAPQENSEEEGSEEGDVVLITAPMASVDLQVDSSRNNCYECYRLILGEAHWQHEEKHFCSEACLERFLQTLRRRCPECGNVFLRTDGFCEQGLWFCSLGCCPNREEVEELFLAWRGGRDV